MHIVDLLIKKHHTRDPFQIAAERGYIIIRCPLYGIRGFYQYMKRNHIIYLDESLSYEDARFVCAHELGHSIMHRGANRIFMDSRTFMVGSRYEREADLFASCLLVDDNELIDLAYCGLTVDQISHELSIPKACVETRLLK